MNALTALLYLSALPAVGATNADSLASRCESQMPKIPEMTVRSGETRPQFLLRIGGLLVEFKKAVLAAVDCRNAAEKASSPQKSATDHAQKMRQNSNIGLELIADFERAAYAAAPAQSAASVSGPVASLISNEELAAACPKYSFIRAWYLKTDKKGQFPTKYVVEFDSKFEALYRKGNDDDIIRINAAYRDCLQTAVREVESDSNYVAVGQNLVACADCKIRFSPLAPQDARMQLIAGLSYLASVRLRDQDWSKASSLIRGAIEQLGKTHEEFINQSDAGYGAKVTYADRQARASAWGAMLGSIVGGAISRNPGVASTLLRQKLQSTETQRRAVAAAVGDEKDALFSTPAPGGWSDDGIRVTIPVLRTSASTQEYDFIARRGSSINYPAFGALENRFPFSQIVKVYTANGGMCTGSFVGARLILTNRHCVFSGTGTFGLPTRATYAFLRNNSEKEYVQGEVRYTIKNAVYPNKDHNKDRANDWALLETVEPSETGWLGTFDPANISSFTDLRVAIAGFSADLNNGSEITVDWGCKATFLKGIWYYPCHTWRGSSGSPIVVINRRDGRQYVVGVNAAMMLSYAAPLKGATNAIRLGAASPDLFEAIKVVTARQKSEDGNVPK